MIEMKPFQVFVSFPTSEIVDGGVKITANTVTVEAEFYELSEGALILYTGEDGVIRFEEGEWFGLSEPADG